jgi:diacylglycerol O-acyltransferase / wax synthase
VNDALVSAISGAMHACVERRGEEPPPFVIAVPVAVRRGTTAADPGNAFTEARARIPGGGDPRQRLADVAAVMRQRKVSTMQPATLVVAAAVVRAMLATGVYDRYMRRQRHLHTVLTNLRGPGQRVTLAGAPITAMLPLAVGGGGNVTVTFAALSYAGTLTVSVTADPDVTPDLPLLTAELQTQLDLLQG